VFSLILSDANERMRLRGARTIFAATILAVLAAFGPGGRPHAAAAPAAPTDNAGRARLAYSAMQRFFYRGDTGLYRSQPAPSGPRDYAEAWPFSQALSATVAVSRLPGAGPADRQAVADRLRGLARYWDGTGYRPRPRVHGDNGGSRYSDDNEWIALELTSVGRLGIWGGAVPRAKRVFELALQHWDRDPGHPCSGGVFWTDEPAISDRNTVSTAPAAELALELYTLTKNKRYLHWGYRFYHWVTTCMNRNDGLYADHVDVRGQTDWSVWSYNQGTMIGANVMLARASGQAFYLERAEKLASTALGYFTSARLAAEPPPFPAIFFHNLLALEQLDPDPRLRSQMQAYANALWRRVDPATGLLRVAGRRPQLIEQAALVRVFATLAGACLTPCN
jgi:hypothetical protein